jgi:hypothetical protein
MPEDFRRNLIRTADGIEKAAAPYCRGLCSIRSGTSAGRIGTDKSAQHSLIVNPRIEAHGRAASAWYHSA